MMWYVWYFSLSQDSFPQSIMVRFHNQVRIAEETRAQMEREKLKSNMLRSISHDFRTPLTGIMGAAGLLKRGG